MNGRVYFKLLTCIIMKNLIRIFWVGVFTNFFSCSNEPKVNLDVAATSSPSS